MQFYDILGVMVQMGQVYRVQCEPGWSLSMQWSKSLKDQDLWYVRSGRGQITLRDGLPHDLRAGVLVWARPGGEYLAEQDPDDRLSVTAIHFDTQEQPPSQELFEVRDIAYFEMVLGHIVDLAEQGHQAMGSQLLSFVLQELRSGICTETSGVSGTALHHHRLIEAAAARIREAPTEIESVDSLARKAGYSVAHFSRLFTEHIGHSPRDYIVQRRIERAQQLLLDTPMTISQIADVLGYSSVFFFSRQFKQRVGMSPREYRRGLVSG